MALCSLVYVSIASQKMADNDLLAILEKARTNNQRIGITGLLLYRDGFFIQDLEGEEEIIDATFERIRQDSRHYNVLIVHKQPLTRRYFSQWAMGFESPNFDDLKEVEGFSDFMRPRPLGKFGRVAAQLASEVEILLDEFRHQH